MPAVPVRAFLVSVRFFSIPYSPASYDSVLELFDSVDPILFRDLLIKFGSADF